MGFEPLLKDGRFYSILVRLLKLQEGFRLKAYRCKAGYLTIGVGHNLDQWATAAEGAYFERYGAGEEQVYIWLAEDIKRAWEELEASFGEETWWRGLSAPRRMLLIAMSFNLGMPKLRAFKKMFAAIGDGDYDRAAEEMLSSRWALQTEAAARRLAQMMRSGSYPPELELDLKAKEGEGSYNYASLVGYLFHLLPASLLLFYSCHFFRLSLIAFLRNWRERRVLL